MSWETLEREGLMFLAPIIHKIELTELTRDASGQSWFLIFFFQKSVDRGAGEGQTGF